MKIKANFKNLIFIIFILVIYIKFKFIFPDIINNLKERFFNLGEYYINPYKKRNLKIQK